MPFARVENPCHEWFLKPLLRALQGRGDILMRKVFASVLLFVAFLLMAYGNPLFQDRSQPAEFSQYFPSFASLILVVLGILGLFIPDKDSARRVLHSLLLGGVIPLTPIQKPWHRLLAVGSMALIWNLITWILGIHFFLHGRSSVAGAILIVGYMFIALILLGMALYYLNTDTRVAHTRLTIDAHPLLLGQPVEIGLEQHYRRSLKLREVRIGLVCIHGQAQQAGKLMGNLLVKTEIVAQQWREILICRDVQPKQHINLSANLVVPREGQRSTIIRPNDREWYAWQVRMHLSFKDGPDYRLHYPVTVEIYRTEKVTKD
jgi:hypothetical protein